MLTTINNFMDKIIQAVGNAFMTVFIAFDAAMNIVTFAAAVIAGTILIVIITGIGSLLIWTTAVNLLSFFSA